VILMQHWRVKSFNRLFLSHRERLTCVSPWFIYSVLRLVREKALTTGKCWWPFLVLVWSLQWLHWSHWAFSSTLGRHVVEVSYLLYYFEMQYYGITWNVVPFCIYEPQLEKFCCLFLLFFSSCPCSHNKGWWI